MNFEEIENRSLRDFWSKEDDDFILWLEENISYLNQRLDKNFTVEETERKTPTGFSADLWVEDEDERQEGVIECQFGSSDHDHLGKLITYLNAFEAKIGIWIVEDPRYEHEKAVNWLNETTDKSFYLVKIEVIQVGDSITPLFTPKGVPSPDVKEIGKEKSELSELNIKQNKFWEEFLEKCDEKLPLFESISPKTQNWIGKSAGIGGVMYHFRILKDRSRVELIIDTGEKEKNEEIFDKLYSQKDDIEEKFGSELNWRRLEDKKSSRIHKKVTEIGLKHREKWDTIQEKMIEAMRKFSKAFDEPLSKI